MKTCLIGLLIICTLLCGWWIEKNHRELYTSFASWRCSTYFSQATVIPINKPIVIDKTFYITLERDPRRKTHVDSQLTRTDIPQAIEIFSAVDGKKLTEADLENLREENVISQKGLERLRKGEVGCALSHRTLWQRIAEDTAIENALILEDDVQLIPDFNAQWSTRSSSIPQDFDLVYLYQYPDKTLLFETSSPQIFRPLYTYCFHGYLISKKGAKKILKQLFPIKKPIDTALDRLYLSKFNFWRTVNRSLGLRHYDQDEETIFLYVLMPDMLTTQSLPTNIQYTPTGLNL